MSRAGFSWWIIQDQNQLTAVTISRVFNNEIHGAAININDASTAVIQVLVLV